MCDRVAAQLGDARLHALGEVRDLRAGVVVVELAGDLPAGPFERGGDRVADRGLAAVAHVQRARSGSPRRTPRSRGRRGRRRLLPKSFPAAITVGRIACSWASARKKLMNPGPAISVFFTRPGGSCERGDEFGRHVARLRFQLFGERRAPDSWRRRRGRGSLGRSSWMSVWDAPRDAAAWASAARSESCAFTCRRSPSWASIQALVRTSLPTSCRTSCPVSSPRASLPLPSFRRRVCSR